MILKLSVTKQSNSLFSEQFEFNRFPVFLGRDNNNQVILPDPLKIVSRRHAKIIDTEGILQLVDLESANFTYLNGEKVLPNEENPLQSNDKIRVGDYELQIEFVKEKEFLEEDDQKTMIFSSPYSEEIGSIVENLKIISSKYNLDDSSSKEKMLRLSLLQNLLSLEKSESSRIIAECLSENILDKEMSKINSPEENSILYSDKSSIKPEEYRMAPAQNKNYNDRPISQEYSFNIHFSNTIDVFLDIFIKLIDGLLQFRQEFFGVTKYYLLPTGSLNDIKEFLFNPEISPDEEKKRLDILKDEAQKLLGHQIGLLEGYNLSITEGSKLLLQSIDPAVIGKELEKKKASGALDLGNFFPSVKKAKVLDLLKEHYRKYISDPYFIEKKFFRPSFIKGYQKRI